MLKIFMKSGFSIAEAMITLLIVSIALAAMAPIISKRQQSSVQNTETVQIPQGAIMYYKKVEAYRSNKGCPRGWTLVSGMDDRYVALTTNFDSIGTTRAHGLPNITGYLGRNGDFGFATNGNYNLQGAFFADTSQSLPFRTEGHNSTWSYNVAFDASRSNGIYGAANTVRPNTVYFVACSKD